MIYRLTSKLFGKLKVTALQCLPLNPNPFCDWSAHLFYVGRVQYVIMTNTVSLYSFLMPGKGLTDEKTFVDRALFCMAEFMRLDGNEFAFQRFIAPSVGAVSFSKAFDRRVTGSMNELIYMAKAYLIETEKTLIETSQQINETPMSVLNYSHPKIAFGRLTLPIVAGAV